MQSQWADDWVHMPVSYIMTITYLVFISSIVYMKPLHSHKSITKDWIKSLAFLQHTLYTRRPLSLVCPVVIISDSPVGLIEQFNNSLNKVTETVNVRSLIWSQSQNLLWPYTIIDFTNVSVQCTVFINIRYFSHDLWGVVERYLWQKAL